MAITLPKDALTVRDLINHLSEYPDDTLVFGYDDQMDEFVPAMSTEPLRIAGTPGNFVKERTSLKVGDKAYNPVTGYNAVLLGFSED